METYKLPVSVLVVVHTTDLKVLLLERADHPHYWQSVTGSQYPGETLVQTAVREIREETGIEAGQYALRDWGIENVYEIYPEWRHRYAPGTIQNTEHVFGLEVPAGLPVSLSVREHVSFVWLPCPEAAKKVFSPSNAAAILKLMGL